MSNQVLGKLGEDIAGNYLRKMGYRIIGRNFRINYGKIDLIALEKNCVVFVEVKTRIGEEFGKPEEAVTPRKLREVIKTAQYYLQSHPGLPEEMRIDVVGIEVTADNKVTYFNHIKSVTSYL
jgi:putative endonuclease